MFMSKNMYDDILMIEKRISLVDYLAEELKCEYVGELHYLNSLENERLIELLQNIPATSFPVREWANALDYLVHKPGKTTAEETRSLLLRSLKSMC